MIKGFKQFVMRGNVVDLAIAVVIGAAFTSLVSTFVSAIIRPVIAALPGGSVNGWGFSLRHTNAGITKATYIDFSAIINAIVVFVLTAAIVYFVFVAPMRKLQELRARGQETAEPIVPEDIALLREIRDALAGGRPPATAAGGPSPAAGPSKHGA